MGDRDEPLLPRVPTKPPRREEDRGEVVVSVSMDVVVPERGGSVCEPASVGG